MKLLPWTLFLDVLGYQDINKKIVTAELGKEFLVFMQDLNAIHDKQNAPERKAVYKGGGFDLYEFYEINTTMASDSIIVTFLPKEGHPPCSELLATMHSANALYIILNRLQEYIWKWLDSHRSFLRGGVVTQAAFVQNALTVGAGLIEAYEIESGIAKNPRIVVSRKIRENQGLMECLHLIGMWIYGRNILKKDEGDGEYYLDYLGFCILTTPPALKQHLLSLHRDSIVHNIEKIEALDRDEDKKDKLLQKYRWLAKYHNETVAEFDLPEFAV